jgi:hypothetical protein
MKALTDFTAALSLLATLLAFATVGEQHRRAHQSGAAVRDANDEPLVLATTRQSLLTAWATFAPARI